jgi:hypothetical protein
VQIRIVGFCGSACESVIARSTRVSWRIA